MTRQARIIHFGKIEAVSEEELHFSNFQIDGADEFTSTSVCILTLVIERLQSELETERAKQHSHVYSAAQPAPVTQAEAVQSRESRHQNAINKQIAPTPADFGIPTAYAAYAENYANWKASQPATHIQNTLDAARYRWLRSVGGRAWTHLEKQEPAKLVMYDAAVDAEMAQKQTAHKETP